LIAQTKVTGVKNLLANGSFIVASNHLGQLDSAMIFFVLKRNGLIYQVNDKYDSHLRLGPLIRRLREIFKNRDNPGFGAIREVFQKVD